jgi:AAA domain
MQISLLSDVVRGSSSYVIEPVLTKGFSVMLFGEAADTSLLMLQLALDIASGKPFLGEFPTTPGEVIFVDSNTQRIQADAQTLNRKLAGMENVTVISLLPGERVNLASVVGAKNPSVAILNQSLEYAKSLSQVCPTIAVAGTSWNGGMPIDDIWTLNSTSEGYRLVFKPQRIALRLSKGDGFKLEGHEEFNGGVKPVWAAASVKPVIKNPAIVCGMKL